MTTPTANPGDSSSSAHEDSTTIFFTKITNDYSEWFELEDVQGRWFCKDHPFHSGDHVKISIRKAPSHVPGDRTNSN